MIGEDVCLSLLTRLLNESTADQTELSLASEELALTRFANSTIHQNFTVETVSVKVRAMVGRRKGEAVANDLQPDNVRAALERAVDTARRSTPSDYDYRFPEPVNPVPNVATWDEQTAGCSPSHRADLVAAAIKAIQSRGVEAFGSLSTIATERAVVNSSGLAVYAPFTEAHLVVTAMRDGAAGYASEDARRLGALPIAERAIEAAERCRAALNPREIGPGIYDVVLLPYAVADLLAFMGPLFFSALAVMEDRSYIAGRLGQYIGPDDLTIYDDGADPAGMPTPFDLEGVGKTRVDLIRRGVLNALVYDSATAQRQGVANTGHAFPPNNNGLLPDPHPANLFMVPGSADLEDLIASTERGILVTRLHYTRCVEPRAGVVSGITREGTFLIERGRVAYPIRNLRFVEAVIPALSRIQLIGRERRVQWRIAHGPATLSKGMGAITVPAVKISGFRFTGATEF